MLFLKTAFIADIQIWGQHSSSHGPTAKLIKNASPISGTTSIVSATMDGPERGKSVLIIARQTLLPAQSSSVPSSMISMSHSESTGTELGLYHLAPSAKSWLMLRNTLVESSSTISRVSLVLKAMIQITTSLQRFHLKMKLEEWQSIMRWRREVSVSLLLSLELPQCTQLVQQSFYLLSLSHPSDCARDKWNAINTCKMARRKAMKGEELQLTKKALVTLLRRF